MTIFSAAMLNLGPGSPSRLQRLLGDQRGRVSLWCLQEGSDWWGRRDLGGIAKRVGLDVMRGTGRTGQLATPLLYDPDVWDLVRAWDRLLLGRVEDGKVHRLYAGPGAGGTWLKPKWLIGARLRHRETGFPLRVASAHWPASQYMPRRAVLARRMSEQVAGEADLYQRALVLVGADTNAKPDARTLAPLRHKGWHLTQAQTPRPIGTHGRRPIDGFAWREGHHGRAEFLAADTLDGIGSDHLPYVATWRIKEDK
ncbi:MAG: hypothetical protein QM714_02655 [Nocardioides sp.]|uniref:hypothetical protein n=1 Tax=Nocardioides sp. TaxID=35761 RepID=UPI0039E6CFFB